MVQLICLFLLLVGFLVPAGAQKATLSQEDMGICNPLRISSTKTDATLTSAIASTGVGSLPDCSGNKLLLITAGTWTIGNDLSVPIRMKVRIPSGAVLSISSGKTLTLGQPPDCDEPSACIVGDGTLSITGKTTAPRSSYIIGDCSPGVPSIPSATTDAFACEAMLSIDNAWQVPVAQTATTVGPLNNGNGTYWLAIHRKVNPTVSGWTSKAGSQYIWKMAGSLPTTPPHSYIFARVTIAGGNITAIGEIGVRVVTGVETVSYARTIDRTATWDIRPGGYILLNAALTFCANLRSDLSNIFVIGTGAVTFCTGTPIKELYPQWWGAIPSDGFTDYVPIQAMLTAAASGQTVYMMSGQWDLNGGGEVLTITKSVEVSCAKGAVLKQNAANTQVLLLNDNLLGVRIHGCTFQDSGTFDAAFRGRALLQADIGGTHFGVKDIEVFGNHFDAGAIAGISGNSMIQWDIHDNRFEHPAGAYGEHGVYASQGSSYVRIHDNHFQSSGTNLGAAVTSNAGSNDAVTDIAVTDNIIVGFNFGVQPTSGGNYTQPYWRIQNNTIRAASGSTGDAIDFFSVIPTAAIVSGNILQGWGENGLQSRAAAKDSIILGNILAGNGKSGARIVGLTRTLVVSNIFANNGSTGDSGDTASGLRLHSTDDRNVILGNALYDINGTQLFGISLGSTAQTDNIFVSNYTYGNVTTDLDVTNVYGQSWLHWPASHDLQFGDLADLTGGHATPIIQLSSGSFIESRELASAPPAGAANTVRMYSIDNGAGKTKWCELFSTGAEQCRTQP